MSKINPHAGRGLPRDWASRVRCIDRELDFLPCTGPARNDERSQTSLRKIVDCSVRDICYEMRCARRPDGPQCVYMDAAADSQLIFDLAIRPLRVDKRTGPLRWPGPST